MNTATQVPAHPPHGALLRVEGEDAEQFLQGQLSHDMRALGDDRAVLSSMNSPKGRVLATLVCLRLETGIGLLVAPDALAAVQRRLQMFVLRARVTLTADERPVYGTLGGPPEADWAVVRDETGVQIRAPGGPARCWHISDDPALDAAATLETLAAADIAAGLPCIGSAQSDAHIAQHLGLQNFGALAFDKGCFTGQEVIARMHYRGGVKRMPLRLAGTGTPPQPGATLRDDGGSALAEVVNSVATEAGCELLVVWRGLEAPAVVDCDIGRFEVRAFEQARAVPAPG